MMEQGKSVIELAWDTYVEQITEAIENGFLDDSIKKIARACFDRRDIIKGAEKVGVAYDVPRTVLPKNPVRDEPAKPAFAEETATYGPTVEFTYEEASLAKLREVAKEKGIDGTNVSKADLIKRLRRHDKAEAEAEAYSEPSKARRVKGSQGAATAKPKGRRRSFSSGDTTFRYLDGRLYEKSDVRGKVFQYQEGKGRNRYWGKITGAGPKSFKVTWVHDSDGTPCPDGDQSHMTCAPLKYRDTSAKDGRKVTFMGLSHFDALMKTITPIKE